MSSSCTCGMSFSVGHAMTGNLGSFSTIRHEIQNLTAFLLSETCHNVAMEPHLQPLNGEGFHHKSVNTDENSHNSLEPQFQPVSHAMQNEQEWLFFPFLQQSTNNTFTSSHNRCPITAKSNKHGKDGWSC